MTKLKQVQTTFQAGELDPILIARHDLTAYKDGVKTLQNFYVLAQGGIMRRPGTTLIKDITANGEARLVPFQFSNDEKYIFAFGNTRLDIYLIDGTTVQSITSQPWITGTTTATTGNIYEFTFAQYGDSMFVAHQSFETRVIKRTAVNTFTSSIISYDTSTDATPKNKFCPFFKFQTANATITPGATSGSGVSLTASVATFYSGQIGRRFRLKDEDQTVYHEVEITGVTNTTSATCTVKDTLDSTNATADYEEESFSTTQGFPGAVTIFQNRLYLAGSKGRPSGLMGSRVGLMFDFDVGTGQDDEAINITLGSDVVDEIKHLKYGRHLQIFTDLNEYYLKITATTGVTPGAFQVNKQTSYGSRTLSKPEVFDGATFFVQNNGVVVRQFLFEDLEDAYSAKAVNLLASHMVSNPIDSAALPGSAAKPEAFILYVNDDGTLAVYHSIRDEKVFGWSKWTTDGNFKSVTAIGNYIYATVQRTINSATKYFIEKFAIDDSTPLDNQLTATIYPYGTPLVNGGSQTGSSLIIDGLTASVNVGDTFTVAGISGTYTVMGVNALSSDDQTLMLDTALASSPADNAALTFTKGRMWTCGTGYTSHTVSVLDGNEYLGTFGVDSNNRITLNEGHSTVKVGLNFTPTFETLPIDAVLKEGPITGEFKRIVRCILDVYNAVDITISGEQTSENQELIVRSVTSSSASGSMTRTAETGKKEFYLLGYTRDATITLTQNDPTPFTLRSVTTEIEL